MTKYPIAYDFNHKRVAILERAFNIGYKRIYNGLWTASFTLPADDPKNTYCRPYWLVEIFDSERVDLFRIMPKETVRDDAGQTITYQLEHVLVSLINDVMFKYHEVGGVGTYTEDVLGYILSKQVTPHWQLGTVEFTRQFQYSWENENLLAALFSVPRPFDEEYRWTWDTVSYPWTLNLRKPDDKLESEIKYRSNLKGITRTEDPTNLCTRLYALGQGEGVNQLGIDKVNPTGLPYIDADTQGTYGVVSSIWVDRRFDNEETLYESAKGMLEKLKVPRMDIEAKAVDIYKLTRIPIHQLTLGKPINIVDEELGVLYNGRIIALIKKDVYGDPGNIDIEITNKPQDVAGTIADLANRVRINEVYSQGATNIDSHQIADNCDPSNPVVIKFHIPTEAVHVNKVLLNYDTGAFRAYSKAVGVGGSVATTTGAGGATTQTTSSGGATTPTTSSGGATTPTTSSGGGQTSSGGGAHDHTVSGQTASGSGEHNHFVRGFDTFNSQPGEAHRHGVSGGSYTDYESLHKHLLWTSGMVIAMADWGGIHDHTVAGVTSSSVSNHTHTVSDHTHSVSIPNHTHSVSIPNHTHSVSIGNHWHDVNIPAHSHGIDYGIYNGPTPTAVTVKVDGNTVSGLGLSETEVNVIDYLTKTSGGSIIRGFHEISVTPNTLGRVNIIVHVQQFVASRGQLQL